jgi:two-component system cell cycle sensor histidine kinase/response regulator CckA
MRRPTQPKNLYLPKIIEDLRRSQSDLKTQNKALQFSQNAAEGASERFQTLFSSVPLALMVVDEQGLVLASNAMALALFRPLETDAPLNFLFQLIDRQQLGVVENAFNIAKKNGTSETTELIFASGANGFFTGDLHMAQIENPTDELTHYICAIIDQSPLLQKRQALQALAEELLRRNEELQGSRNRLSGIINSSLDAIICADQTGAITVFNPAAAALFHANATQVLGTQVSLYLPDLTAERMNVLSETQDKAEEIAGKTSAGDAVLVEASMTYEKHANGHTTTIFARDITERKKIEAQRNRLEAQLRESQKMQAMGTMAGGIAHDFNNIISAILGNAELALQEVDGSSAAQVSLNEIDKAGRRARDLVHQILTFSRDESPQRTPIQLADVIKETVNLIRVTVPETIQMQVHIDPSTPFVLADATQVEQALLNLCTNAIQAIGNQRGNISIELGHNLNSIHAQNERRKGVRGKHVKLTVTDTGVGMDADTAKRIYDPFFTTKPMGQGTGLGLSVVHGVMRTHEGTVAVQSTPDIGSVFTLCFPISIEAPLPITVRQPPTMVRADFGLGKHIMYVDDDEALLFLVKRALTKRGFEVSIFHDPRQAVEALRERPLNFDLLITDYNMPGYSGLEVLREAHLIHPELPIALASGYVTPEIERNALAAGARALIYKPNDVEEMCATLQRLLQPEQA